MRIVLTNEALVSPAYIKREVTLSVGPEHSHLEIKDNNNGKMLGLYLPNEEIKRLRDALNKEFAE